MSQWGSRSARGAVSRAKATPADDPVDSIERAREICLRQLAMGPRTKSQLALSLRKREISDETAEQVLDRFTEVGLIDDAAFALSWVESRHRGRGLARRALAHELRSKGVADDEAVAALETLGPDEEAATARELVDRKLRSTRSLDSAARVRRLSGMLARKGYPPGIAFRVVREAMAAEAASLADEAQADAAELQAEFDRAESDLGS